MASALWICPQASAPRTLCDPYVREQYTPVDAFPFPGYYYHAMNQKVSFSSKALEVNLDKTRRESITIPPPQKWFLSLSQDHSGLNARTKEFLTELNHPYPNYPWIINNLKKICLGDFWFYSGQDEPDRAFAVIIGCFEQLISRPIRPDARPNLLHAVFQFLDKLLTEDTPYESSAALFLSVIESCLQKEDILVLFAAGHLQRISYPETHHTPLARKYRELTRRILEANYLFWKKHVQVDNWIRKNEQQFKPGYIPFINETLGAAYFSDLERRLNHADSWDDLKALPMFREIAEYLRDSADIFQQPLEKIYYLYYLLQLSGLNHLKDHLLWDINRLLKQALASLEEEPTKDFVDSIFSVFQNFKSEHMSTVLDCIETLGREIVLSGDGSLIEQFTEKLITFGFVYPGEVKIDSDWQVEVNPDHLKSIRVWLSIIECNPSATRRLITALIVHLKVGGVFIQDTDLFQKDISRLLNSDFECIYKLLKHLVILFPIFYNEIGAEGELRDVTTRLDEISGRRDGLIHFLRKQVHVESNNTHVRFAEEVLRYWHSGESAPLLPYVPQDVVNGLHTNSGWFKGVHSVIRELCAAGSISLSELMQLGSETTEGLFSKIKTGTEDDRNRVRMLLRLYWLLYEKYSISTRDILHALRRSNLTSIAHRKQLEKHLNSGQKDEALEMILTIMTDLKAIILDPTPSESWENIYYKRHIAAGIPSMYGQYHEKKYEALGLTLRLEYTADRLMEELIDDIIFSYTNLKNLKRTAKILEYFLKGLEIRGIYNQNFESNVHMLQYSLSSESFSIHQYINIFQFFIRNIRAIIDQYFITVYDKPLKHILRKKWESLSSDIEIMKKVTQESESFFRDMLASSFFIQTLDRFLSQVLRNLREMRDTIPHNLIHRAMSYDPDLLASPLYEPMTRTDNKIFLGAKAYFLKKLISFGFPIPEGFILTTELFRHRNVILMHPQMEKEVDDIIRGQIRKLEENTGCVYGDPENPLLLSVRSGSAFSMPGAMNTFLNVGMNRATAKAMGRNSKYAWAAWDCYRRLLQSWGMSYGIQRDEFDLIMKEMKQRHGVEKKRQFTPEQMEKLSDNYAMLLEQKGISFETDIFLQMKQAIMAVIDSWFSNRAKVYRKHLQIADEWGTAVLIQRMMFGNLNENSGTGVVFTKNPFGDDHIRLYGDYIPCSQGEDIVSGLVHTLPIKVGNEHKNTELREDTLEKRYPIIYRKLEEYASILIEEHDFPHQEIEFTFESPDDVYILQTRAQAVSKQRSIEVFDTAGTNSPPVGRGIGVGSGVLNGIAAFNLEDIIDFRKNVPAEKCILLRPDTVPDDIEMVFACDGLLTARGGVTSHAAVTAEKLGKVCVVNCRELKVNEAGKTAELNGICFNLGDRIAIDGFNGSIYSGNLPVCTRDGELIS